MKIRKLKHKKRKDRAQSKLEILFSDSPFAYSESYKSLRTNLDFVSLNNQCRKILITSAIPGEGKSSVAINLAVALAENGSKVLLMDCDLRKPMIQSHLRVNGTVVGGLSSLLRGVSNLDESVYHYKERNIDVMFAGTIPPNPVELLGLPRMGELIETLGEKYDYVICDTPPVVLMTDAAVLSRFCDGVLMVIRQKYATVEQVKIAQKNLKAVGANIIGAVLNQYDIEQDASEGRKGHGYYYYSDGYKYGYGYGYAHNRKKQDEVETK